MKNNRFRVTASPAIRYCVATTTGQKTIVCVERVHRGTDNMSGKMNCLVDKTLMNANIKDTVNVF